MIMKKVLFVLGMLIIGLTSHSLKAQTDWIQQTNPLGSDSLATLGKIQFVSSTEGWISAASGKLLHTTDAGATWNIVIPFPNDTLCSFADPAVSMWWVNQTHGWRINWLGTEEDMSDAHGAVMHKTIDGGSTWEKKVLSTATGDMGLQVQFVDENNGWAIVYNTSGDGRLLRSTDGGNVWNPITVHGAVGLFHFVDANNGWSITGYAADTLATPEWSITRTTDGGENWSVQYIDAGNTDMQFNAIQFTDVNNGWVVGDGGKIFKTTNGGIDWTQVTNTGLPSDAFSKCVFFVDANNGWIGTNIPDVLGDQRAILRTTDGGSSWTWQYPTFLTSSLFSLFFQDANIGWFIADWGGIGYTTNGGATAVADTAAVDKEETEMPDAFSSQQNYPNPFNPSTIIRYYLPRQCWVKLDVYEISGKRIARLINKQHGIGSYEIEWNGKDELGKSAASGIYFYRLTAGKETISKKMVLLR
jgi:photosystem II stability/assembly factor-like uncharacterized protein